VGGWKGETLPTGLVAPPPIPPCPSICLNRPYNNQQEPQVVFFMFANATRSAVGIAGSIEVLDLLSAHSLGAEEINEGWPIPGKMKRSIM